MATSVRGKSRELRLRIGGLRGAVVICAAASGADLTRPTAKLFRIEDTHLAARHLRRPIIRPLPSKASNKPLPIFSALGCNSRFCMTRIRFGGV